VTDCPSTDEAGPKDQKETQMNGLAIDLETLWILFYGLIIGILVVYVRRAVQHFRMKTGGKW
jgi:hypothetical protein